MAYPQFALMTLQLIAPSSNMTLQEYKDAYGIDLTKTDIHAFKLVLFGDEKYAIDQIKDVEDGHEVYFNGRVLTITDTIETSSEIYDVANAKPIYYHPIYLADNQGETLFRLQLVILDNSPTAYTTSTIIAKLKQLMDDGALINVNGPYRESAEIDFRQSYLLSKLGSAYKVYEFLGNTLGNHDISFLETNLGTCTDGVNKIN